MARGYKSDDDDDYVTIEGTLLASSAGAFRFQGDFWEEPAWVPRSQSTVEPVPDSDNNKAILKIKTWLAKKNGWE